jgi:hypothetical protein
MARWLLVHPPLLGPTVLRPVAEVLRQRGDVVVVPDLRAAVDGAAGWPGRWTAAAAESGPADAVLGFSGAGVTLPGVAAAVDARRVVWLDAPMPARAGATVADEDIRSRIPALLDADGRIRDWTTWWGPDALDELVADPGLRAAIRTEGHRLPGDFYDVAVPVPAVWPEGGAWYVQLSAAYADAAEDARQRGWPVLGRRDGDHLDVANHPIAVADLVADL